MKYIDEFRNKSIIKKLSEDIYRVAPSDKEITLMEVCGTHTQSFFRYGLAALMPKNIQLISGPGCPVCVTDDSYIDQAISYAQKKDVIITTFGDMMRVPGSESSLEKQRAGGCDIRIVYSSLDALSIAQKNPDKKVIFLGVGFETTAPTIAIAIKEAKKNKINNFFVFSAHKLIPPAMQVLVKDRKVNIDGFLCPGHVSTIIGARPYQLVASKYRIPCVIAGFEPSDVLEGILMLVEQIIKQEPEVQIQYRRVVKQNGNPKAIKIMREVFEICDASWRGLGKIPRSGLKIRKQYQDFDAGRKMRVIVKEGRPKKKYVHCLCGEVLKGLKKPSQCRYFAKLCNPHHPLGPCMVSSEGSCSIYFKYIR